MVARNRTWIRQVSSLFLHNGGNVVVFAVGAVYDRATFVSGWAKCAVIDRAYSGKPCHSRRPSLVMVIER